MKQLPKVKWGDNVLDVFKFASDFFKQDPNEEWVEGELDGKPIYFNRNGLHTFEKPNC